MIFSLTKSRFQRVILCIFSSVFLLSGCLANKKTDFSPRERGTVSEHVLFGYPGTEGTILNREGYVLCHNNKKKVADWASYHLTSEYLIKRTDRTDDFRPDLDLPEGQRSELEDYRGSGYDRGHLVPARDMARSRKTMSESFLLSNMAPQIGHGFNRGIWRVLEEKVRNWTQEKRNVYVITGPVYEGDYATIGPDEVAVPPYFYKIVVSCCAEEGAPLDAIAFILPNKSNPDDMFPEFITTIDEIEKKTGLDFLHELNDRVEDKLEARKAEMW